MKLRAATRGSALALWQTHHVARLLATVAPDVTVEPVVVSTEGDRRADVPLSAIGGKGVFVREVQAAVLDGRADLAVHSGKDLPALTPEGLVVAAVPRRGDPRDVLVGARLGELGEGAVVATGAPRRRAQLAAHRPDLVFAELRGNIDTRLEKAVDFDAIVMAAAALDRLGRTPDVVDPLPVEVMVPQVAQGALAVECRAVDSGLVEVLAGIEDPGDRRLVDTERAFLAELGGDCDLPAGAHAVATGGGVSLTGVLASPDGRILLKEQRESAHPELLGRAVARHLLDDAGGARLLGRD